MNDISQLATSPEQMNPTWRWERWYPNGEVTSLVEALGQVVFVFGELEYFVKDFAAVLLDAGTRGLAALRGQQVTATLDALVNILKESSQIPDDLRHDLEGWAASAKHAVEERNKVIHAKWQPSDAPHPAWRRIRRPRRGELIAADVVTRDDLEKVRDLGIIVLGRASDLWQRFPVHGPR